jgi:hypothetical protein
MGVRRVEDPHHPRGYRELRSNGEMRKLLDRKIVTQNGFCALCNERFTDYGDIVPDHIHPRGMGGAWRDDHPDNIQAVPLVVQRGKGIEQRLISGLCAIFRDPTLARTMQYNRIDPETRKRDPHHAGIDQEVAFGVRVPSANDGALHRLLAVRQRGQIAHKKQGSCFQCKVLHLRISKTELKRPNQLLMKF